MIETYLEENKLHKFLMILYILLFITPLSANDVLDVYTGNIELNKYIEEYNELKPVKQFEKFKDDCKKVGKIFTRGVYNLVYDEPKLLNVDAGFATYSIDFHLKIKNGVKEINDILDTIKMSVPSLIDSHFTPYDCKNLLSEGQYFEIENNYISIAILEDTKNTIATLPEYNNYIQFSVNHNGKIFKSKNFVNATRKTTEITVPVDCEFDNLSAQFQSIYGFVEMSLIGVLIGFQGYTTPPENSKRFRGDISLVPQYK